MILNDDNKERAPPRGPTDAATGRSTPDAAPVEDARARPPVEVDAARPSLGLEGCDTTVPLPPVTLDNYYPSRRECKLAGEYDPANFCLIARALASQGVTWTSPVILTRAQSRKRIVHQRRLGLQAGGIVVNPRSSGEVLLDSNGEWRFFCVSISPAAISPAAISLTLSKIIFFD